jgi:hypothetical protein
VTLEELDIALEELETRLERLRALYEQYFLGFEKIEPAVARKDVDRRIYVLRREKIRNTGKRFKLQTIIQRYNTFQQYWQRICREIENGTYKRHILRAERQLAPEGQLTIAARRRFGKLIAAGAGEALVNAQNEAEAAARPSSLPPRSIPPESVDPPTDRPPVRESRIFESEAPTQVRRAPPPKPVKPRPLSSQPPEPAPGAAKLESIELDMGALDSWEPPPPRPNAPPRPAAMPANPTTAATPPTPASPPRPAAPPPKPLGLPRPAPPPKPQPKPKSSPQAAPPPKPAPSPPAAAGSGLSEDRVRLLHEKLTAMKRENKEAGQVSFENLSRTLRDTERKLREQHKDRKIDFDVVIRDGKAIVKPTVK